MATSPQNECIRQRASALGVNLALAREAAGITQTDLAERAKTSRATIAQIESGGGDPRLSTLSALSEALGIGTPLLLLSQQDIEKLREVLKSNQEVISALLSIDNLPLLDELSASGLAADRRKAARISAEVASKIGFDSIGAAVGAAIGTTLLPGIGTAVGAFFGGVGRSRALKRRADR
jgi:transcriptional regulator with XRE-family HTH domain